MVFQIKPILDVDTILFISVDTYIEIGHWALGNMKIYT
jgi:hypothetical protein